MTVRRLAELFTAGHDPAAPVAVRDGVPISFTTFTADVATNAARIRKAGGHRVLLSTQDVYWGAAGLLAIIGAGCDVVFAPNDLPATLEGIGAGCDFTVTDASACLQASLQLHSACDLTAPPLGRLSETATITFHTSGSTGAAKQIIKTLRHLEREAAAIDALFGAQVPAQARIDGTVPHQHAYGMAFRLIWPLVTGRVINASTHLHWEECLAALGPAAMLVTSPAHLTRLDGLPSLPPARRPCFVLSAGAPLPQPAALACLDVLGCGPYEIFGSTETGAIAGRQRGAAEADFRALPGVQITRDGDGLLRAEADYIPHGAYTIADRIDVLPDGRFRFLGRSDDVVKIEGKRLSLAGTERALTAVDLVTEAAAVVLSGDIAGRSDRLAAVVVLSPAGNRLRQELGELRFQRALMSRLRQLLEPAAQPRSWRFVAELPRGVLGKRRAADLAALFATMPPDAADTGAQTGMGGSAMDGKTEPDVLATRRIPDGIEIDLQVAPDLAYLDGHFQQIAIVPGVVQIDWACAFARSLLGLEIESAQSFQVKFRKIIQPGVPITLRLMAASGAKRLTFLYSSTDGGLLSSGSIAIVPSAPKP
jgi:hypothetical protein